MAIQYEQDTGKISTAASTTSNAPALTPSVGNHLFALVSTWAATTRDVTFDDDQTNVWNTDVESATPPNGNAETAIGSAKVVDGVATVVTATSTTTTYWEWIVLEFSGLASSSHLDQIKTGTVGEGSTTLTITADAQNATANALVLVVIATDTAQASDWNGSNPPSTYATRSYQPNAVSTIGHQASSKDVSSLETSTVTWNFTALTAGSGAGGSLATYKSAGGAATQVICCG